MNFCPKITDTYVYTNWTKKKERKKGKNTEEEEEPKETVVLSLRKIINLRRIVKQFLSVVLN